MKREEGADDGWEVSSRPLLLFHLPSRQRGPLKRIMHSSLPQSSSQDPLLTPLSAMLLQFLHQLASPSFHLVLPRPFPPLTVEIREENISFADQDNLAACVPVDILRSPSPVATASRLVE